MAMKNDASIVNAAKLRRQSLSAALLSIIVLAMAGCAQPDHSPPGAAPKIESSTQPTPDAAAAIIKQDVKVTPLGFDPSRLTVARGTTVVWTSDINNACTIVSGVPQKPGAGPLEGVLSAQSATYSYKFDIPGEYPYFNEIQPGQAGTIVVSP